MSRGFSCPNASVTARVYICDGLVFPESFVEKAQVSTIVIGGKYTSHNGVTWECIGVKGDNAWMASDCGPGPSGAAYSFKTDGTNICQGGGAWNVKWEPVVEWVEDSLCYSSEDKRVYSTLGDMPLTIRFPLIDGKPDFTQATVSPL